ncbi:hypothetical protein AVEN_192010-1 [Araneus ventricosus]|uniref:DDE-1 domain-containing protein n=1 Tax=Araneus ventricosus TaxID=182803 RepID=A0A4Y2B9R8_ARAVE|nr:hypothetical protein AVEN_192010-1 [Araneus ventricosus]
MTIKQAALMYSIPRETLSLQIKGWKGRKPSADAIGGGGSHTTLTIHQEQYLAMLIKTMNKWGFSLKNGWMIEALFLSWFKNAYVKAVTARPNLLIYDGHVSHLSIELVETAIEWDVTILKLPAHSSHMLQPLDGSIFRGIKSAWGAKLKDWARHNVNQKLPKSKFADLLGETWRNLQPCVIQSGFKKCGIYDSSHLNCVNHNAIPRNQFDPNKLRCYDEWKSKQNDLTVTVSLTSPTPSTSEELTLTTPNQVGLVTGSRSSVFQSDNTEIVPLCSLSIASAPTGSIPKVPASITSPFKRSFEVCIPAYSRE